MVAYVVYLSTGKSNGDSKLVPANNVPIEQNEAAYEDDDLF
jgi:PTS system mannose-specific IIC component